jgi:hypothetical protein
MTYTDKFNTLLTDLETDQIELASKILAKRGEGVLPIGKIFTFLQDDREDVNVFGVDVDSEGILTAVYYPVFGGQESAQEYSCPLNELDTTAFVEIMDVLAAYVSDGEIIIVSDIEWDTDEEAVLPSGCGIWLPNSRKEEAVEYIEEKLSTIFGYCVKSFVS